MSVIEKNMGELKELETAYYGDLEELKALCFRLIESGQPYQVVVLCHELYRFLYPIEPYADFRQTDPVPFAVEHQRKVLRLGRAALEAVRGYAFDPAGPGAAPAKSLEVQTSDLYSNLWAEFDRDTLLVEARKLLERRIPAELIEGHVKNKRVLDMGCGSGRYSLALAAFGAREVIAVDYQAKAYQPAERHAKEAGLPVTFQEADVLQLPFPDASFDFVFSNGVLHHTRDWKLGVREYARLMKSSGYLYLYACGGFFWKTRAAMREIFARIPQSYTHEMLRTIGMPRNRFIFMDTWYVPVEGHLKRAELEALMQEARLSFSPLVSKTPFDLDYGLSLGLRGGEIMWGEGEHRYWITR